MPQKVFTLSNNSDVEGQYTQNYVQCVISIHLCTLLTKMEAFQRKHEAKIFEIPPTIRYRSSYQPVSGMMKHKIHALLFYRKGCYCKYEFTNCPSRLPAHLLYLSFP